MGFFRLYFAGYTFNPVIHQDKREFAPTQNFIIERWEMSWAGLMWQFLNDFGDNTTVQQGIFRLQWDAVITRKKFPSWSQNGVLTETNVVGLERVV